MKSLKKKKNNNIKLHDTAFKFMINLDGQGFLDRFGIKYTFDKFLATENVLKINSQFRIDCLILTKEGYILIIEFQSTYPNKEKLETLKWYATLTEIAYEKEVRTFVVTIPPVEKEERCNELKSEIYHKTHEVSCNDINGKEILNNIKHKINNNIKLKNRDKLDLLLATYTTNDVDESAELLEKAMDLTHELKTENRLQAIQKSQMKYILMLLCDRIVKDERCEKIRRKGKMGKNTIFDEIREETRIEVIEENTKEITTKIATKMKNLGTDAEYINQTTGLSLEEINKL